MKNYYDVLEVSRKASKDTINKVFKMHMKANHPDLFQGEDKIKAEEKSKELTEAYNTLSDDNQRAKYDAELEAEESVSQTNSQIETILQENEYLKQVIAKKDAVITRLTGNDYGESQYNNDNYYTSNSNQYSSQNYSNGSSYSNPSSSYSGMSFEQLKQQKNQQNKEYYIALIKEYGTRFIIFAVIIILLLLSLKSTLSNLKSLTGR